MITTIALFYGSLVLMVVMMGIKLLEVSRGKEIFTTRISRSIDHVFEAGYRFVRDILGHISWYNIEHGFWWCVRLIFKFLHISYKYVEYKANTDPRSKKIIDMVKGKGMPTRSPGASIYLKRIKAEKSM